MFELLKKSLLASLGAAVVTKEKIEDATKGLVEQGKLTTEEAEKLAEELIESGRQQWEEVQEKMSDTVRKGLDSLDISSKKEFQELASRVEDIEKRLSAIEQSMSKD